MYYSKKIVIAKLLLLYYHFVINLFKISIWIKILTVIISVVLLFLIITYSVMSD